jgi:REP element-mobilizing transposase RayT
MRSVGSHFCTVNGALPSPSAWFRLRAEYPEAICYVKNRGDRREPIFQDAADRRCFVETLGQRRAETAWEVHALCLMPNHFHLVVETPQANRVIGMKWFLDTKVKRLGWTAAE